MQQKRRFRRVVCNNKAVVVINDALAIEVNILNISMNGVFFECVNGFIFHNEDKWQLTFKLDDSDIKLKFATEVVHAQGNRTGVKFIHMDIDTKKHLGNLIRAITPNLQMAVNEFSI